MRNSKLLLSCITICMLLILSACNSSEEKVCPQCHMPVLSFIHSAKLVNDGEALYFDDIGCMILYAKEHNIDLKAEDATIFSNDTKKYLDINSACYVLGEETPMRYGFAAYEFVGQKHCMKFDEVNLKMLRGENMANPKIRKKIMGSKY